jgi:hypothetical protein
MASQHVQLGSANGKPYAIRRYGLAKGGDTAISTTIRVMQHLVLGPEGVRSPEVRIAAIEAARGSQRGMSEIESVFSWVKNNIEFRGENAEFLQTPKVTLQLKAGDCDDHAVLTAALLRSLGFTVRFNTVAAVPSAPSQFSHVYVEVKERRSGKWIPLDTTVARSYPGWQPERITRMRTYQAMGDAGPAPIPGLTPNQQLIYALEAPFVNAAASQIAHGTIPEASGNLNLGLGIDTGQSGGIPNWMIWLGAGLIVYMAIGNSRRR